MQGIGECRPVAVGIVRPVGVVIFPNAKEDLPEARGAPLTFQEGPPERSSYLFRRMAVGAAPNGTQDNGLAAGDDRGA
eukprot:15275967-Alexandrium_andersonii.AAC.1